MAPLLRRLGRHTTLDGIHQRRQRRWQDGSLRPAEPWHERIPEHILRRDERTPRVRDAEPAFRAFPALGADKQLVLHDAAVLLRQAGAGHVPVLREAEIFLGSVHIFNGIGSYPEWHADSALHASDLPGRPQLRRHDVPVHVRRQLLRRDIHGRDLSPCRHLVRCLVRREDFKQGRNFQEDSAGRPRRAALRALRCHNSNSRRLLRLACRRNIPPWSQAIRESDFTNISFRQHFLHSPGRRWREL